VRLGEVAHVLDSVENDKDISYIYGGEYGMHGTRGVNLNVARQPGSNTIAVTDAIKKILPQLQAQILPSQAWHSWRPLQNIREAFQDIQFTMAATLGW